MTVAERDHIETRLLIVSEMLDKAVEELSRVMGEIRNDIPDSDKPDRDQKEGGKHRG